MKPSFVRLVCRLLVVCLIGLPFQVNAGMIGTDQAVSAAQGQAARASVLGQISRADVAARLESFGLTPQNARDRVAALTDEEVTRLAGQIDSLPAGAATGLAVVLLIAVLLALVWVVQLQLQKK